MQKRSKKGFTLAELLIVVAILAVLVAIAVPLFVGALNNSEDRVKEANERALRGLAVAEVLSKSETYMVDSYKVDEKYTYIATATVDNKGGVSDLKIYPSNAKNTDLGENYKSAPTVTEDVCYKVGGKYYVAVYFTATDAFKTGTVTPSK